MTEDKLPQCLEVWLLGRGWVLLSELHGQGRHWGFQPATVDAALAQLSTSKRAESRTVSLSDWERTLEWRASR